MLQPGYGHLPRGVCRCPRDDVENPSSAKPGRVNTALPKGKVSESGRWQGEKMVRL
jgi:hypothetical protein